MFDIEEELGKLPKKPGVYIMHDENDAIIYIGKAKVLRNRVRQYFHDGRNLSPKIAQMVTKVRYFEYIIVDTEMEALVLENNLVSEHQPKYNTKLKDDKAYPFIKVTLGEEYPRVIIARKQVKDRSKYFGPYTSGTAIREILEIIRKTYYIRACTYDLPRDRPARPCLYHQIKQCKAPCQDGIGKDEYRALIGEVMIFLNGNYKRIAAELEDKMKRASDDMEFEEAAGYRDLLLYVKRMAVKQKASDTEDVERDVVAFATNKDEAVAQVFFIRNGKMLGREHYYLTGVEHESRAAIMTDFVKQYYAGTPYIPKELLLSEEIEEEELITSWLSQKRGFKVTIHVPKKGEKEKLVELAEKNAEMVLAKDSEKIKREEAKTLGANKELADMLSIPSISRIESYDISNISGYQSVASMVVYENGKQKKSDYRKFKIKWVSGPDDYASMQEVLTRRFLHGINELKELEGKDVDKEFGSFTRYPDLIMMDGGKGQVNAVLEVLSELDIRIPVCGMVKDDAHRTRGLYFNNVEIPIDTRSEGFKLITRIQNETHRFAIEYHRSLRGKNQVKSILDDIEGIGATRRRQLMRHFESIDDIKAASVEELARLPGMNRPSAESVYGFFHKEILMESVEQAKNGQMITKSLAELEAMEDD